MRLGKIRGARRARRLVGPIGVEVKSDVDGGLSYPGRPVIRPIPLGRSPVLAHLVADVLDAAEGGKHFAAGAAVAVAELAGEALFVASAPVEDQPSQPRPVDRPAPGRPDGTGLAGVVFVRAGLGLWLVVARGQENLVPVR